ncbi:MAG: VWA domain-containing protein [Acidobacteriota bacterium]|nr:VWA domain-containing protein [Acidobacteriota bacterium]MDH3785795.1 VWA domain-containing protein [Acidobacteriota bacterium]
MGLHRPVAVLMIALVALSSVPAQEEPASTPQKTDVFERTTSRLVQIDVSVTGPADAIVDLAREDFQIFVQGKPIDHFTVDPICDVDEYLTANKNKKSPRRAPRATEPAPPEEIRSTAPIRAAATYLLYFDQHHLTMAGRQGSIDAAREILPDLLGDGDQGLIVSAGKNMATIVPLTDDLDRLLAGLDRLEADRDQWDPYPYQELSRINELMNVLQDISGQERAIALAREYQREEQWLSEKALRLFGFNLTRLTDLPHPKAVIYFADTMRANPGEHYISFFSSASRGANDTDRALQGMKQAMDQGAFGARNPFDRVLTEAAAHGVRVYTIEAQGLTSPDIMTGVGRSGVAPGNLTRTRRVVDAQNSLVSMAHETGGEAYLNGIRGRRIASDIRADISCMYLLSFDAGTLARDQPLPIVVHVSRKGVKPHHRGQIVVQSEESRKTGQLLAAFASPETTTAAQALRTSVIPIGFEDGRFVAMVQLSIPPSLLNGAVWDIGTSLVAREQVRADDSARITISGAGVPVIFETQFRFRPGPFELISVAHESTGDETLTGRYTGEWQSPGRSEVSLHAMTVLQPGNGLFLRDGKSRNGGSLVRDRKTFAQTERPTAVIGLICAGNAVKGPLTLTRHIAGDDKVPFPEMTIDVSDDRCVQFRDFIPPSTMTEGRFDYQVEVKDGKNHLIHEGSLPLYVAGDESDVRP